MHGEAVSRLMWLSTMAWLDISNVVRAVARHSHRRTGRHWKAVLKNMACLHGPRGLELTGVRDADCAGRSDDRRSVSGRVHTLGGATVSWASSTNGVLRCPQQKRRTSP